MEPFTTQAAERAPQLGSLVAEDLRTELTVLTGCIAVGANPFGHVEDDGHGKHVVLLGQFQEPAPSFGLDIGGVDHGQSACFESLAGDEVQNLEGCFGRRLVVLVVAYQTPTEVRGDDFGGDEVLRRECRLSRA